jgi:hypothetical protein
MKHMLGWLITVLLIWFGLGVELADAHGFQTAYLDIQEQPSGQLQIIWKTPTAISFGDEGASVPMTLRPVFPARCEAASVPSVIKTPQTHIIRWTLECGEAGLAGEAIAFPGIVNNFVEVLLRLQWADGRSQTTLLPTGQEVFVIPDKVTVLAVGQGSTSSVHGRKNILEDIVSIR